MEAQEKREEEPLFNFLAAAAKQVPNIVEK